MNIISVQPLVALVAGVLILLKSEPPGHPDILEKSMTLSGGKRKFRDRVKQ